ncbi:F-box/FBD/LRR-repeat protein [Pyrus ussuriensis x Pyrus communis]|uniref:F-box/FBD/LRR-repeat protein n=1 Tax=Pyrus ussuriensis x Pyrus communis TaxID=2448454 RepID=A0A5N5FRY0_9ROSA|nr:F-box/FBD/LRR-repeat protein [Pyrus ussuriensis x Pyrus communis]
METSSVILSPKRQKLDGGEEMEGRRKELFNLPDEILLAIISLLETKDAIGTSILSTLWNIVEKVLLLRGPPDIKVFELTFLVLGDACRVKAWISAALRRNPTGTISLPHSLFTNTTLTVCDLDIPFPIKVPSTVCFSSLKNFSLRSVVFSDDSAQRLFSGCPVLEELYLENCIWLNNKFVSICSPKLLTLFINESDMILPEGSDGCQFMIYEVSLQSFCYRGELQNEYCFYDSSSSKKAEIHLSYDSNKNLRHAGYRLCKLLRGLTSMERLTFSSYNAFRVVVDNAPELLSRMPLFNNWTTFVLEDAAFIDDKALWTMLQYFPHLETLIFAEGVLEPLPPCFLSHLKRIEVGEFNGDQYNQLNAVRILLKNAKVLKKLDISWPKYCTAGAEQKAEITKQVFDFPRASGSCEVVLR